MCATFHQAPSVSLLQLDLGRIGGYMRAAPANVDGINAKNGIFAWSSLFLFQKVYSQFWALCSLPV